MFKSIKLSETTVPRRHWGRNSTVVEKYIPLDDDELRTVDVDKLTKDIESEVNLASNGIELKLFDKLEDLIAAVSGGMVNWKNPDMKRGRFPVLQPPKPVESLLPDLVQKRISTNQRQQVLHLNLCKKYNHLVQMPLQVFQPIIYLCLEVSL